MPNPQRTGLALALLLAALCLAACGEPTGGDGQSTASTARGEVPAQQFFDYRLIESNDGVRQWILQSEEMQKFTGQRDVILVDVHMDFFRDGAHFSVLTSDSGRANLQTRNIHTWGNVVVITDDGRQLETEQLYFNNETQLIHNEVFNRFTRQHDVMTGIGLEATPDLEYIELKEDVKAEVTDSSDLARPAPIGGAAGPGPEGGQQ